MPTAKDDDDETQVIKNILSAVLLRLYKIDKSIKCIPRLDASYGLLLRFLATVNYGY